MLSENIIGRAANGRFVVARRCIGDKGLAAFNPSLPRRGRVARQCKRAFIAHQFQPVTMATLRQWCFPGQPRKHWHYGSIYEALKRLGARRVGWGVYAVENCIAVAKPLPK